MQIWRPQKISGFLPHSPLVCGTDKGHFFLCHFFNDPVPNPHWTSNVVCESSLASTQQRWVCAAGCVISEMHDLLKLDGKTASIPRMNIHASCFIWATVKWDTSYGPRGGPKILSDRSIHGIPRHCKFFIFPLIHVNLIQLINPSNSKEEKE